MSVDVGMQQIMSAFAGGRDGGPPAGAEVAGSLDIHVGRLAKVLERQLARDQEEAQACAPVDLGPLDFTVISGQPKLKAARSTTADNMSPSEGFYWFVTRLSLSGLNAGDVVNLHRPSSSGIMVNSTAVHTFTGPPAQVGPGLITPPVPASGTAQANFFNQPVSVTVSGGTVTIIAISGAPTGFTSGTFVVQAGGSITLTYSVAPTWTWSSASLVSLVTAGLGVADWEPGALGMILRPDDTFNLVSAGTLTAAEIILTGQAIQVASGYLARYLL